MSEFIAIVVYIHDKTAARRLSLVTSTSAVRPHCRRLWLRAAKAGSPACPPACSDRHIPYPSPHLTACRPRPPGRCPPSARPMTVGNVTYRWLISRCQSRRAIYSRRRCKDCSRRSFRVKPTSTRQQNFKENKTEKKLWYV